MTHPIKSRRNFISITSRQNDKLHACITQLKKTPVTTHELMTGSNPCNKRRQIVSFMVQVFCVHCLLCDFFNKSVSQTNPPTEPTFQFFVQSNTNCPVNILQGYPQMKRTAETQSKTCSSEKYVIQNFPNHPPPTFYTSRFMFCVSSGFLYWVTF